MLTFIIRFIILCSFEKCVKLAVLDFSGGGGGGGGVNPLPSVASQPSKFLFTPTGLVKNSQKYIADPLSFNHKSSTESQ